MGIKNSKHTVSDIEKNLSETLVSQIPKEEKHVVCKKPNSSKKSYDLDGYCNDSDDNEDPSNYNDYEFYNHYNNQNRAINALIQEVVASNSFN